jgi:hypothetical protein
VKPADRPQAVGDNGKLVGITFERVESRVQRGEPVIEIRRCRVRLLGVVDRDTRLRKLRVKMLLPVRGLIAAPAVQNQDGTRTGK